MKKSLCILSICFAAFACCSACKQYINPENLSDPKAEIKQAVKDACFHVYVSDGAKGGMVILDTLACEAIAVEMEYETARGGEQENIDLPVMGITVFDKLQEDVPDALYLDGGDGKEPVKVENIKMVTPIIATYMIPYHIMVELGVEPILMATENVDGAPADNYLVDIKTIEPDRVASIDVLKADEVENNLEKFADKCFLDVIFRQDHVLVTSVSQIQRARADGEDYPTYIREPIITRFCYHPFSEVE